MAMPAMFLLSLKLLFRMLRKHLELCLHNIIHGFGRIGVNIFNC